MVHFSNGEDRYLGHTESSRVCPPFNELLRGLGFPEKLPRDALVTLAGPLPLPTNADADLAPILPPALGLALAAMRSEATAALRPRKIAVDPALSPSCSSIEENDGSTSSTASASSPPVHPRTARPEPSAGFQD